MREGVVVVTYRVKHHYFVGPIRTEIPSSLGIEQNVVDDILFGNFMSVCTASGVRASRSKLDRDVRKGRLLRI